ncbi:MAG TPA: T9SS type A sorting domain-containing protein [Saprospiraceae bacterium]|nr:T9SS type A sorting domain-containing protein [Saprospiraceae bacterium]
MGMKSTQIYLLLAFCTLVLAQPILHAQIMVIEEFTNVGFPEYADTKNRIDSLLKDKAHKFCQIKYHTEDPVSSSLYSNQSASRLLDLNFNPSMPSVRIDGIHRPSGSHSIGSTLNLNTQKLDSLYAAKPNDLLTFFGLSFTFSPDFKKCYGSSGNTTSWPTGQKTFLYRVLVEEMVDLSAPIGPGHDTTFTNVFRAFIDNKREWDVPNNGSVHGWSECVIPSNVVDKAKLKMVVFLTNASGRILNSTVVYPAKIGYKIQTTNSTDVQESYCDSLVTPAITVLSQSPYSISGFKIHATIDDSIQFTQNISSNLEPGQQKKYDFDKITLKPGLHYINTWVEYITDDPATGVIIKTNDKIRYLVKGDHPLANEDFENLPPGSQGRCMVRTQNDLAFKKVSAADLGHDKAIGAYGQSDYSLMFDAWHWIYDETDKEIIYLTDNKNFGFLLYNSFDLSQIKFPVLQFDVAHASKSCGNCLNIDVSKNYCDNNWQEVKKFVPTEINTTTPNTTSFFIPKSNEWKTMEVSLDAYEGLDNLKLRMWASNPVDFTKVNAFYLDNIKIVSGQKLCNIQNLELTNQAQVDSFALQMNGCNSVSGNLIIGQSTGRTDLSDIKDLSRLKTLKEVDGNLVISHTSLKNLSGLEGLKRINGHFILHKNDSLISGKEMNLTYPVAGNFVITENSKLANPPSLINVKEIKGDLVLAYNPMFPTSYSLIPSIAGNIDITHMNSLKSLGSLNSNVTRCKTLKLENNPLLSSLTGLWHIAEAENIILRNNPQITTVFFQKLEKINGDLIVENMNALTSMSFHYGNHLGKMHLRNNPLLNQISTLDKLNYTLFNTNSPQDTAFILENNPSLSQCKNSFICKLLADPAKTVFINNNGMGCESNEVAQIRCTTGLAETTEPPIGVYPNPFVDEITIYDPANATRQCSLLNALGKIVNQFSTTDGLTHDMSYLEKGVYLLHIEGAGVIKIVKL